MSLHLRGRPLSADNQGNDEAGLPDVFCRGISIPTPLECTRNHVKYEGFGVPSRAHQVLNTDDMGWVPKLYRRMRLIECDSRLGRCKWCIWVAVKSERSEVFDSVIE